MTQAQKAKAAEAKAAEEDKAVTGLDMVAINTVGNNKPGDKFKAKDKAAFDRLVSLGAAKPASK